MVIWAAAAVLLCGQGDAWEIANSMRQSHSLYSVLLSAYCLSGRRQHKS